MWRCAAAMFSLQRAVNIFQMIILKILQNDLASNQLHKRRIVLLILTSLQQTRNEHLQAI